MKLVYLEELDLSHNEIGDYGVDLLCKSIIINKNKIKNLGLWKV